MICSNLFWRRQWQPTPVLLPGKSHGRRSLVGWVHGVAKSRTRLSDFTFTFPGTGQPSGLPSMGSHRAGHDWGDLAAVAAATTASSTLSSVGQHWRTEHYVVWLAPRTDLQVTTQHDNNYMINAHHQGHFYLTTGTSVHMYPGFPSTYQSPSMYQTTLKKHIMQKQKGHLGWST